ncbi:hypothetical protein CNR22_14700 [Sphingobacteriaceae bacterium]|nr:hypothetical protein CNR22_14700 [Sphingobacteriaceae bacterium]
MILRFLVFILLPCYSFAQSNSVQKKEELTKVYSQGISEYIKAIYTKDKSRYDTLFFGKNPEFPDIKLPTEIANTKIFVLTQEQADKKLLYKKSLVYINMMGWVTKANAQFMLVTFFVGDGYRPQHNCEIDFNFDAKGKVYKLDRLEFKYPYSGK